MHVDHAPNAISERLLQGETLLWFGRLATRTNLYEVLIAFLAMAAFVTLLYLDGYVLLFGAFPSLSANRDVNSLIGVLLIFALIPSALKRSRRLRRTGHRAYALTDRRLMIVRNGETQSLDRSFFNTVVNVKIAWDKDLVFELPGEAKGKTDPKVTLHGVHDPQRVACLIRCTLAPHTLTYHLAGAIR